MSIFSEVKEHVTAREAAEFYGLVVLKKGIACCPFHDDKHLYGNKSKGLFRQK